jgi:formylglycine-generating enzyme required for sulfatase activity
MSYDLGPTGLNATGSIEGTTPATSVGGSFAPNGYGLYDMAGNLFEGCWDWYGIPYAGGSDPHGAGSGTFRVLRGGSWNSNASIVRCAARGFQVPTSADPVQLRFGLRTAFPAH